MQYIDSKKILIATNAIKSNLNQYKSFLDNIENTISEVESKNSTFNNLNGQKIASGEKKSEVIIKESSIASYCTSTKSEIENMRDRISSILRAIDNAEESIQVIANYLLQVEEILNPGSESNILFGERLQEAYNLMENDAMNGYSLLHSTPVLMNGDVQMTPGHGYGPNEITYSGPYLQFFNEHGIEVIAPMAHMGLDTYQIYTETEINENISTYTQYYNRIMDNINNRYTDFHRQALRENLSQIILEDSDYRDSNGNPIGRDNGGLTTPFFPSDNTAAIVNMPIRPLLNHPEDNDQWSYVVDSFTHETGHVLDNYLARLNYQQDNNFDHQFYSVSDSRYTTYYIFQDFNPKINDNTDFFGFWGLRPYGFINPMENFAESVAEYYGDGIGTTVHYSPDDLKGMVFTVFDGSEVRRMSSYEIFDNILNGRDFYG